MLALAHVDAVDHNQATQVAQAQLAGHLLDRFKVGLESGVFHTPLTAGLAGIDIDRDQRFGRLDDQVATGRQRNALLVNLIDLFFKLEFGKDRPFFLVQLDPLAEAGLDFLQRLLGLLQSVFVINQDLIDIGGEVIADSAKYQARILVDLAGTLDFKVALLDFVIALNQRVKILLQLLGGPVDRLCADDVADPLRDGHLGDLLLEALAFAFAFDFSRYASGVASRHDHHVASRQRQVAGQGRTLVVATVLLHLHDQLLPPPQHLLDARPALTFLFGHIIAPLPEIRMKLSHLEEARLTLSDVDKSGLQTRFDP